ncbi:hypothetical protein [Acidovorax sp. BL-A-41-H1]|uniref:hypothetical protein n=1 Tax=Acidovorax sp. BL-A-41-H1 TaxID=3421102 RepID=UPI003F7A3264
MSLELNQSGGGETLATHVSAGEHYQVLKLATGGTTEATPVSETAPLPVRNSSPLFWRVGFAEVGAGLQGLAAAEMTLLQTGAGMAVSQSGGNLVITTGTTANSETVLRSNLTFKGSMLARYKAILSQRIINQTFRFELADLIGSGLSYTINSATSVTVTFPTTNPFTAANVGQSLRLSVITGAAGIPGRYPIASVSGLTVTFTVSAWPASGSGLLTLYGHNWLANEYTGTTATNSSFDCQRRGWNSGATGATINTTASPGHVAQIAFDVLSASLGDALVASTTGYQWASRASRIENIPDEDVSLYFFVVVQNGSTAPASTTTLTVGFVQVEDQGRDKVRITTADPVGSHPAPVQVMNTLTVNQGTMVALPAGTNAIGDVGGQYRANATGAASIHHIVSAATTNPLNVKASAGRVVGWGLVNTTASYQYVKLHNTAGTPTAGASVAMTIAIPPNGVNNSPPSFGGIGFATGIARTIVTGSADTDATATTLGAVVGDIYFA